ncbi:hypothetical protein DDB_G0267922 [Dictyostelium discoideum AX4]|uniref:Uncharacterized protein n=1 Tax=Dictyostelium discoideum TaxID=44689 RepID=Q55FW4_DICDI|nr:hypothetical protein DDB_G0267922 [Dictyostelium discoideum AX4]EAL73414.1 hypothetical protein DDB_G0267922 [Dictyostelium discoideum AX4]|eukprot:XP_647419.1 hypothetical protein DDB_G0267922 [Dictyostelium discoideum AX4]
MYFKKCDIFEWICEAYDLIEEANSGGKQFFIDLDSTYNQYEYLSMKSIYLKNILMKIDLFFDQLIKFKSKIKGNISNQEINFSDNQITVS